MFVHGRIHVSTSHICKLQTFGDVTNLAHRYTSLTELEGEHGETLPLQQRNIKMPFTRKLCIYINLNSESKKLPKNELEWFSTLKWPMNPITNRITNFVGERFPTGDLLQYLSMTFACYIWITLECGYWTPQLKINKRRRKVKEGF